MTHRHVALIGLLAVLSAALFGQNDSTAQFEVASVRQHLSTEPARRGVWTSPGGRVSGSASLRQFVLSAWDLKTWQVTGGPSWIDSDRFDLSAKVENADNITLEQARPLLQALLAARFQLKFHNETRNVPIYALLVDKQVRMKPSAPDATTQTTFGAPVHLQCVL